MSKMKTLLITGTLVVTAAVTVASGSVPKNTVTIFTDEGFIEVNTPNTIVEDILKDANINLLENQRVFPPVGEELVADFVTIKDGVTVVLKVDGEEYELLSWAETVNDLLEEQKVELSGGDIVNHPLEKKLSDGKEIEIVRVKSEIITVENSIPSTNRYYHDSKLPAGSQKVQTHSKDGVKRTSYKVTYHDGVEVDRVKLEEEVISQPVQGIIHHNPRELASRSSSREYAVVGVASYYGDKFHGRKTANGEIYDKNAMTAAHRTLPYGTMVEVTYLRTGKSVIVRINDRGPFIDGRVIDLSEAAAREIGLRPYGIGEVRIRVIGNNR